MAKSQWPVVMDKLPSSVMTLEGHQWHLRYLDRNCKGVVKMYTVEGYGKFGSTTGDHSKNTIHNLFANVLKITLCLTHILKNQCQRKEVQFSEYPQSQALKGKSIVLTASNFQAPTTKDIHILSAINVIWPDENIKLFALVGDPKLKEVRYNLHCTYCGDYSHLCPPKENLEANLAIS